MKNSTNNILISKNNNLIRYIKYQQKKKLKHTCFIQWYQKKEKLKKIKNLSNVFNHIINTKLLQIYIIFSKYLTSTELLLYNTLTSPLPYKTNVT